MDTLYRIHTEGKPEHIDNIHRIVSQTFDGYTSTPVIGSWRGVREHAVVIEIYATRAHEFAIRLVAENIKRANNQESVLVVSLPVTVELV